MSGCAASVTVCAPAKLNLSLDVIGKRPDGYHELEMVMQAVSLSDTVTLTRADDFRITCRGITAGVPEDEDNIALRAARAFFHAAGLPKDGIAVTIEKRIPVAAGLAGGSADAAAVLCGLNALYGAGLTVDQICAIGLTLGADVPFCIRGGCALATGAGETMHPLPTLPECDILLVKDGVKPSTKEMYRRLDETPPARRPDTARLVRALERGTLSEAASCLCNVFEPLYGEQAGRLVRRLTDAGAYGAALSGSGPTVFALCSKGLGAALCRQLCEEGLQAYLAAPVGHGCRIL